MTGSRYLANAAGTLAWDGRRDGASNGGIAKEPTLTAPIRAAKVVAAIVSVLLFASISGAYAYFRHEFGRINKIDIFGAGHDETAAGGAVNFLLVGTDSGAGLSAHQLAQFHLGAHRDELGQRSDTMILLHVSKEHNKVTLISMPRDSWVTIPAYWEKGKRKGQYCHSSSSECHPAFESKINSAYSYGGPALAVRTVEAATGVPINHYVEIHVLGLANIVDALGGVRICVSHDINDAVGGDSGHGGSGLILNAGWHKVDGVTAVKFARTRHDLADQDLGRIKRQQALLGALFHEAVKAGTLLNPVKLNNFVGAAVKSVTVDSGFSRGDMITLADSLHSLSPKHVTFLTVPIADANYRTSDGQSAVLWDSSESQQLFQRIKQDVPINGKQKKAKHLTIPPSSISVKVLNGTDRNGLAHQAATDLANVGFVISGDPSDASSKGVQTTEVHYGSNRADSARTLAAAIPGSTLVSDQSLGADGIAVVLGQNYHGAHNVTVSSSSSSSSTNHIQTTNASQQVCT